MIGDILVEIKPLDNAYLICIDPVTDILMFGKTACELTYGKLYYVELYKPNEDGRQYVRVINDMHISNDYLLNRFVTKEEFRDIKINKILC